MGIIEISKVQDFGNFELSPMHWKGDSKYHNTKQGTNTKKIANIGEWKWGDLKMTS